MTTDHNRGFLYCAVGEEFVAEAERSAESVKLHHDEPITLVTNVDIDSREYFDRVIHIEEISHPAYEQIRNLTRSPYDRTIKLDTDTFLTGNVSGLFDWLDRFDMALAIDPAPKRDPDRYPVHGVPDSFPEYNGGVIVYNNDEQFAKFQSRWEDEFAKHRGADPPFNQPSLRKSVFESNLRVATLPCEYNCRYDFVGHAVDTIRIFHGRMEDVDSYGMVNKFDMDEVVTALNSSSDPRAFASHGHTVKVVRKTEPSRFQWLALHIKTDGYISALKNVYRKVIP